MMLFLLMASVAHGGEIVIHRVPAVEVQIIGRSKNEMDQETVSFIKEFRLDATVLAMLPGAAADKTKLPVTKGAAQQAALDTVDSGGGGSLSDRANIKVISTELKTTETAGEKQIDYYLFEFEVRGSSEQRIVLMDGSVLKPVLKQDLRVKK